MRSRCMDAYKMAVPCLGMLLRWPDAHFAFRRQGTKAAPSDLRSLDVNRTSRTLSTSGQEYEWSKHKMKCKPD